MRSTLSVQYNTPQAMWLVVSKHEAAGLYFLAQGTITNGLKYVQLLQEKLNVHMMVYKIFMPDKAPCHRSKVVSMEKQGRSS